MGMSPSRRVLVTALAVAVLGLAVSVVLLVRAWAGGPDAGAADFGPAPSPPVTSTRVPDASPEEQGTSPAPTTTGATRAAAPEAPERALGPVTLSLPRLGVRAPVDPVGVASDGQVEVPGDPRRVGWYRYSPSPGASAGSAVLVGHVDSAGRGLGVLVALNEVRRGDRVEVVRADGGSVDYRVVSRRTVAKRDLGASDTFRTDGPPVLRLVTCTGPYLPKDGGYRNNLVVTAVEVPR